LKIICIIVYSRVNIRSGVADKRKNGILKELLIVIKSKPPIRNINKDRSKNMKDIKYK